MIPVDRWTASLRTKGLTDPWLLLLFIGLHAALTFNALVHPPDVGYDAEAYLAYIQALSEGHLPTPRESRE